MLVVRVFFAMIVADFKVFLSLFLIKLLFQWRLLDIRWEIANSALRELLSFYHLISNARTWNNCQIVDCVSVLHLLHLFIIRLSVLIVILEK